MFRFKKTASIVLKQWRKNNDLAEGSLSTSFRIPNAIISGRLTKNIK